MVITIHYGKSLEIDKFVVDSSSAKTGSDQNSSFITAFQNFLHNFKHPLAILILQIFSIIFVARIFSWLMNKIGQPTVIGEIIAGIFLGPSILGYFYPSVSTFLFPVESLQNLQFLSQIGLILFMFIIGMELDIKVLKKSAHDAIVVSHASIIIPYFLGVGLAYFLYQNFAPNNISFTAFALFIGIAMSITAFPVLARIVQEKGLTKDRLGILAITCAAVDDVTAWSLLAAVIAIVKAGSITSALFTIAFSAVYVVFMLLGVKRFLNKIAQIYFTRETVNKPILALIFGILLLSSYLTEVIGIHALFGAFIAGVIIPANESFRRILAEKIEDFSLVFLLPLFFVYTGLRTEIGLLNDINLWIVCLLIIIVAVTGKFIGSALAAKFVGQNWHDSLILGALMNTRGLMELVVLNIGYDLGILSPQVFAMLVLMALSTTFMTGPSIELIERISRRRENNRKSASEKRTQNILISFGAPASGERLLLLASKMVNKSKNNFSLSALHLTPSADISFQEAKIFEQEGFAPILNLADNIGFRLKTIYKATNEVINEIVHTTEDDQYDLLLVGGSRALFSKDETGGKIKRLFDDCNCSVGVLLDHGFNNIDHILLILRSENDHFLLNYAEKFLQNPSSELVIWEEKSFETQLSHFVKNHPDKSITICKQMELSDSFLQAYDLIIMSLESWNSLREVQEDWSINSPSILIINK